MIAFIVHALALLGAATALYLSAGAFFTLRLLARQWWHRSEPPIAAVALGCAAWLLVWPALLALMHNGSFQMLLFGVSEELTHDFGRKLADERGVFCGDCPSCDAVYEFGDLPVDQDGHYRCTHCGTQFFLRTTPDGRPVNLVGPEQPATVLH